MEHARRTLTAVLLVAIALFWGHYAIAEPHGTLEWADRIGFWGSILALAALWAPAAVPRAARFFADWGRTAESELKRFLLVGLLAGLVLRFWRGGAPLGLLGMALLLGCGLALLVIVARQDRRRWSAGERWPALRWVLVVGLILSFAVLAATAFEGPLADVFVPVGAVCFWGLLLLLAWLFARGAWRRIAHRRGGPGGNGELRLPPPVQ